MLIPLPFASLVGAVFVDTATRLTNTPRWFPTARHLRVLGLGTAAVVAVPGIIDYVFSVPPRSSAGQRATLHGLANLSAVALSATLARSRRHDIKPRTSEVVAQIGGAVLMGIAGWLGGTLACGTVQCPWHGLRFEVQTGEVARGPAREPIRVHTVEERDGRLWLRVRA